MLGDKIKIINNKRFALCVLITFISTIIMFFIKFNQTSEKIINFCTILSLIVFIIEVYNIYKITGEIFSPITLFLIVFYCFQSGQLLLLALGIDFNKFYINTLKDFTGQVIIYSAISNMFAGLAGVLAARNSIEKNIQKTMKPVIDSYSPKAVSRAAWYGIIVTGICSIPLLLIRFFGYAVEGGYYAVRAFDSHLPSIFGLMDYMFVPFCFLYLVFSVNKKGRTFIILLSSIWFIFTALCGDRTTGIAGLLILAYIGYFTEKNKKKKVRYALRLIVIGIFLIVFIKVAYAFRMQDNIKEALFGEESLLVGLLSELGWSCFPLFMMMNIVPSVESFQFGKQYILSAIGGIFPSSLDFTGIIQKLTSDRYIYEAWINQYYSQYNFGVGFSLNAEAYINFGWFGFIAIFILCYIIFANLSTNFRLKKEGSRYGTYKVITLLFLWLTLPRRSSYYIWNALFWCVFVIGIYLKLMCSTKKNHKCSQNFRYTF